MATVYSCAMCGETMSELPSPEPQVCDQCKYLIRQLHTVRLQDIKREGGPRFRGVCRACGLASLWLTSAGMAHGWQEQHQREVIQRLHDEAFT